MSVTDTPSGIEKSMLLQGLEDPVVSPPAPALSSTQFFTKSNQSDSLVHKARWDSGPLHLLFPGPPAGGRGQYLLILVISAQRAGGRGWARQKL